MLTVSIENRRVALEVALGVADVDIDFWFGVVDVDAVEECVIRLVGVITVELEHVTNVKLRAT